jgi:hypothetical protein
VAISSFLSRFSFFSSLISFSGSRWEDSGLANFLADKHEKILTARASPPPKSPRPPFCSRVENSVSHTGNSAPLRSLSVVSGGKVVSDEQTLCHLAADFWSRLWTKRSFSPSPSAREKWLRDYQKNIDVSKIVSPSIDLLASYLTHTKNTAPGPDGIPFAAWRAVPEISSVVLFNVFSALSRGDTPPPGFNFSRLVLLPKKSGNLLCDTRPICFHNTDNRF